MYYLGIDAGSISMKGVLIDENKKIIKSYYTKNAGLTSTITEVIQNLRINSKIDGCGITGSGKEFISILIGGDITESEVISHYIGAIDLYPHARTLMDIGGEDSKLLLIDDNHNLISFMLNSDCGGGCGAMIESIAQRMGILINDVGDIALKSTKRINLPSKCGVFCQSAVVSKLNKGMSKEDILMGVMYGFVGNYFTMLAKGKSLNPPFVFQGATAKNKALVKCFEEELKHEVIVPEYPELMGAYGMAILSMWQVKEKSKFKGFDISKSEFKSETRYGTNCSNSCEISEIYQDGKIIGILGNRCERCI